MKKFNFIKANDIKDKVISLHENGLFPGHDVGFNCLKEYYRVKLGCTTYYTGSPTSGKSEFMFEVLMNLSEFHGWKHLIYSPETGYAEAVVGQLAHKYTRQNFSKQYGDQMSEAELFQAMQWIDEHFTIMDCEGVDGADMDVFMKEVEFYLDNYKVQTVSLDPWNEIAHSYAESETKYIEYQLGRVRRFARKYNIHFNIVAHPTKPQRDKSGKPLPATAYDISGSANWYNKGESILCLHREDPFNNEVQITIQKAKPKEVGKKGIVNLFFDAKMNRYYEHTSMPGEKKYAKNPNKKIETKIQPNESFDNPLSDSPF